MFLTFEEKISLLEEYLKKNKKLKKRMVYKDFDIGAWLDELKTIYSKGTEDSNGVFSYNGRFLSINQIHRLNEIGVTLDKKQNLNFKANLDALKSYYEIHHAIPNNNRTNHLYMNIGKFVLTVKRIMEKGKKQEDGSIIYRDLVITKEELELLNDFNFLELMKEETSRWDHYFKLLDEYLNTFLKVPTLRTTYKKVDIGRWFIYQKVVYNNGKKREDGSIVYKNSVLRKEQIQKLESLNTDLSTKTLNEPTWDYKYNLLKEYVETFKCFPKQNDIFKGEYIGRWLSIQKMIRNNGSIKYGYVYYKTNKVSVENIKKLDDLGVDWTKKQRSYITWDQYYNAVKEFIKNNNRFPIYSDTYNGINIGQWLSKIRTTYNNGKELEDGSITYNSSHLTKEQINKLNDIDIEWVSNINIYAKTKIKDSDQMDAKRRYLDIQLKKLEELNTKFNSKEDVEEINNKFKKLVYSKKNK